MGSLRYTPIRFRIAHSPHTAEFRVCRETCGEPERTTINKQRRTRKTDSKNHDLPRLLATFSRRLFIISERRLGPAAAIPRRFWSQ